jgi:hypothetical protein
MRTALRTGMTTALLLGVLSGTAGADMTVYYRSHGWDAFSGPDENAKPVCGIGTTKQSDKRSFSLRFGDVVIFRAKKSTWNIPAGTAVSVVLQIGHGMPWTVQGAGMGQLVEWPLDPGTFQPYEKQFRRARSMTVTFPSGSEPPWTIALKGSKAISNAFGHCIKVLTQREVNQTLQSFAPADRAGTQPFREAPEPQREAGPPQPFGSAGLPAAPH